MLVTIGVCCPQRFLFIRSGVRCGHEFVTPADSNVRPCWAANLLVSLFCRGGNWGPGWRQDLQTGAKTGMQAWGSWLLAFCSSNDSGYLCHQEKSREAYSSARGSQSPDIPAPPSPEMVRREVEYRRFWSQEETGENGSALEYCPLVCATLGSSYNPLWSLASLKSGVIMMPSSQYVVRIKWDSHVIGLA